MDDYLIMDRKRYEKREKMPFFQMMYRKCQTHPRNNIYKIFFKLAKKINLVELSVNTKIGGGLYFGHPSGITITPDCIIGKNVNIHKGVTIGRENRGHREGCPIIGDNVWIGINATIVGKITVGNDVLIAPNSFVNQDIPDHSIVFGNPAIIKATDYATDKYINNMI